MSSAVEFCIWFKSIERQSLVEKFIEICNFFKVKDGANGSIERVYQNDISGKEIVSNNIADLNDCLVDTQKIKSIRVSIFYSCYRFKSNGPVREGVWLTIQLNLAQIVNPAHAEIVKRQGHIQTIFDDSGPFFERSKSRFFEQEKELVEDNLISLIDNWIELVSLITPSKIKAFTDIAEYYSFNSHFLFFENKEVILQDILELRNSLLLDSKNGQLFSEDRLKNNFHPYRNEEQLISIRNSVREKNNANTEINNYFIESVLNKGEYDTITNEESVFILDYPYFLNRFVDSFVLDLL